MAGRDARDDSSLEGYGHPLYPAGDPRARYLLERLSHTPSAAPGAATVLPVCAALAERLGAAPNADLALAALELACAWPPSAGLILFALARSAGWIAHAAEQAATGVMIRPRSRYVGRYGTDQAPL